MSCSAGIRAATTPGLRAAAVDLTHGWGGRHPVGVPVFVVPHAEPEDWPHPDAPFTCGTDGVASAQAGAAAGGRTPRSRAPTSRASASTPGCSTRSRSTSCRSCLAGMGVIAIRNDSGEAAVIALGTPRGVPS